MADKNSFVFYTEYEQYFSMMTTEQAGEVLMSIFTYQTNGKTPLFSDGMQNMLFRLIKNQLDRDNEKWEETVAKRSENGKKGGRPKKAEVLDDENEETEKADVFYNEEEKAKKANGFLGFEEKAKKAVDVDDNVSVNVNEDDNEHEDEHERNACVQKNLENKETEEFQQADISKPQKDYAEQVFDILYANGLPCCGNLLTFTMRDFRLALSEIQSLRLHSNDVISAVKNYADVIKLKRQGNSWWDSEQSFYNFCKNKTIMRFLPDSFNINNYTKTKTAEISESSEDYAKRIMNISGVTE